jgi:hypothetical protein
MDKIRGLPREQKMLGVAGAMIVFIISLFLTWYGVAGFSAKGTDIDSWWIALILAVVGGGIYAAEALNFPVPVKWGTIGVGALCSLLVFFWAFTHLIDGGNLKFGAWLGLIASAIGAILAGVVWNQERT